MRVSTLAELRDALVAFCEQHPELADEAVSVHLECGYAGAYIAYPVTLYKEEAHESVSIYTDDDRGMDNFGLIGFKQNNIPMVREVIKHCLDMLTSGQAQRLEFWAFSDNPVCKLYRRFAKSYGGVEVAHLHRTVFYDGKYHDSVVWEFLVEDVVKAVNL